MPSNIEWKAKIRNATEQRPVLECLADGPGEILQQRDTFFRGTHGRLKLREFDSGEAELIFYERPDQTAAKRSNYSRFFTDQPENLRTILALALGVVGVVRKTRRLYRLGQTRIHWDEVEGLGEFLEVEVVLRPEQSEDEGVLIAAELRHRLGVHEDDLIARAYVDLLGEKAGS
jgi:predicted adenylyl cyclase CyaB